MLLYTRFIDESSGLIKYTFSRLILLFSWLLRVQINRLSLLLSLGIDAYICIYTPYICICICIIYFYFYLFLEFRL